MENRVNKGLQSEEIDQVSIRLAMKGYYLVLAVMALILNPLARDYVNSISL